MPEKAKDPDLRVGLTQARKKPRNYVMFAKGSSVLKLIVQEIKAGDIQKTKAEVKANLIIDGTCQAEGTEMVFQVLQEPSVKIISIKELINDQTLLTMKARFEVVKQLTEVDENEEDENESDEGEGEENEPQAPSSQQPVQPTVPPPPPSTPEQPVTPPPTNDDPSKAIAQLTAAMNKLSPVIQAAAKANPNRKGELATGLAKFQQQIQAKDAEGAKATLLQVGGLAKQLAQASSATQNQENEGSESEASEQPVPAANNQAAQWAKVWAELEKKYEAALKTAPDDLASKMRVVHAYAFEQAEAGQYDKALAAVQRLQPMLDQAAQGKGPAGEVAAGTVEKRKFMIERFRVLVGDVRSSLDKLKAAIAAEVPDEDAGELCGEIDDALTLMFDEIQDEIDAAINSGDTKALGGLKNRVVADSLIGHLAKNPLVDGSSFQKLVLEALSEVESKLAS